ncbi:MAG: CHASE3 domain-containing protein [Planctomycetes bacterium]|nr:CHASE3 domain-containing protein [Planctomycetota bacterium]
MTLSIERQVITGFAVTLLLFSAIGTVSYRSTTQLASNAESVKQASEVLAQLAGILSLATDAETGQRGFTVTGDESFLEPYHGAAAGVRARLLALRGTLVDPAQQRRLDALELVTTERLDVARQIIEARRSLGFEAARDMTAKGMGKQVHDRLRAVVREMQAAEEAILREREEATRATARFTVTVVLLGAGIALLWVIGALLLIQRSLRLHHQVERALREAHEFNQAILDGAEDAIISGDAAGIRTFNRGAERLLGWSADEVVGRHTAAIFFDPAEIAQRAQSLSAQLNRAFAPDLEVLLVKTRTGQPDEHEWTFIRKDGSRVPVLLTVTALRDATGAIRSFLGIARDITAQKRAEAAMRKSYDQLALAKERAEAADRVKSAFLATMSHELRTPLNSIIGFTGVLLQELAGPLNAEQRKQLQMVRDSARHLLALINDVLDISKIEAGELRVDAAPFDLRASIEKVAGIVKPLAEKKGLRLDVTLPRESVETVGDPRRVEQVLLNLLNNAIKFTERGSVALTVRLSVSHLEIAVSDTGIGIEPHDLATLFRPFRQVDSTLTRAYEGTGLGLAISQRLARLMGGELRAESEWRKGSVFTLALPLTRAPAP